MPGMWLTIESGGEELHFSVACAKIFLQPKSVASRRYPLTVQAGKDRDETLVLNTTIAAVENGAWTRLDAPGRPCIFPKSFLKMPRR